MAKVKDSLPGKYSLGDISVYTARGIKGTILRRKGGPTKKMIKTEARFARTRENNSEFGAASKVSSAIGFAINKVKHLGDHSISGRLNAAAREVMKLDDTNSRGKRGFYFSKHLGMLDGFSLNHKNTFDSVVRAQLVCRVSKESKTATITMADLQPRLNFINPFKYPFYRIIMTFGIIADYEFDGIEYNKKNLSGRYYPQEVSTEWGLTSKVRKGADYSITLEDAYFEDCCCMIVAVGVEFGVGMPNNDVDAVKYAGCAKILVQV